MKESVILITGASGCVGQYTSSWLLNNSNARLLLLLRDTKKLSAIDIKNPRIKLLVGDLREVHLFADDLKEVTHVIHTATAWGDPERAKKVNIEAVKQMFSLLNPSIIKTIIYFSTASILNKDLEPLKEALAFGTEYIQTKAICLQELEEHHLSQKIIAVFPTLVFGGDFNKGSYPKSYLTEGLKEAMKWLWLARWFKAYSRFHFIHAADIAYICGTLCIKENTPIFNKDNIGIRKLVLGQPALSIDQAIKILLKWRGIRSVPRLPLWDWLIEALIKILPLQLSSWDRFSIKQRHFVHNPTISPEDLGGISYAKTLNQILLFSGLPRSKPNKKVI